MPDNTLTLGGVVFCVRHKSNATSPADRQAEDLHFAARDTLEDLRKLPIPPLLTDRGIDSPQAWLLHLVAPIAAHYGVDKDALWDCWSRHYLTHWMQQMSPPATNDTEPTRI